MWNFWSKYSPDSVAKEQLSEQKKQTALLQGVTEIKTYPVTQVDVEANDFQIRTCERSGNFHVTLNGAQQKVRRLVLTIDVDGTQEVELTHIIV